MQASPEHEVVRSNLAIAPEQPTIVEFDEFAFLRGLVQGMRCGVLLIDVDGQDQLVVFMAKKVAGLDPNNGELLWSHAHETMFGVNVCTPVWCKANILFISSAYGMGSRGLRLTRKDGKTTVEELWHNPKVKIHFGNAIYV